MNVKGIHAPVIEHRFGRQLERIGQGLQSGELTKGEAKSLFQKQLEIAKDVYDAKKNDGHLDRAERKAVRAEQRQASRDLFVAKHDGTTR